MREVVGVDARILQSLFRLSAVWPLSTAPLHVLQSVFQRRQRPLHAAGRHLHRDTHHSTRAFLTASTGTSPAPQKTRGVLRVDMSSNSPVEESHGLPVHGAAVLVACLFSSSAISIRQVCAVPPVSQSSLTSQWSAVFWRDLFENDPLTTSLSRLYFANPTGLPKPRMKPGTLRSSV